MGHYEPSGGEEKEFYAGFKPFTLNYEGLALNSLREAEKYVKATSLDRNVKEYVLIDIHNAIYEIEHALGRA